MQQASTISQPAVVPSALSPATPLEPSARGSMTEIKPAKPIEAVQLSNPLNINPATGRVRRGSKGIAWRVAAVMPCFGKHKDVEKLLVDLSKLDLRGIELWTVIVDNNTPVPISTVPVPANVEHEHVRMESNTGGAGGFNAGMARVIAREGITANHEAPDFLWLLDSDVRVARKSLRALIKALVKFKNVCAGGSALVDPRSGTTFEIGGRINRTQGRWGPAFVGDHDRRGVLNCDYLAACSMLVRYDAVLQTGLMPDIFIHGDDVRWGLELQRATGKRVVAVPGSRAFHPRYEDKWGTWVRYYSTRNHVPPVQILRLGGLARGMHGLYQTLRAVGQEMMGLTVLADLHMQGLEDAVANNTKNVPKLPLGEIVKQVGAKPLAQLSTAFAEQRASFIAKHGREPRVFIHPELVTHKHDFVEIKKLARELGRENVGITRRSFKYWKRRARFSKPFIDCSAAAWRAVTGQPADIAIVLTGWPTSWLRAPITLQVTPDAFLIREIKTAERIKASTRVLFKGLKLALQLVLTSHPPQPLPLQPAGRKPA